MTIFCQKIKIIIIYLCFFFFNLHIQFNTVTFQQNKTIKDVQVLGL